MTSESTRERHLAAAVWEYSGENRGWESRRFSASQAGIGAGSPLSIYSDREEFETNHTRDILCWTMNSRV